MCRYVIGKWDLESGVEYGWLTSLGQIENTFTLFAIFEKPFYLLPSEEDDTLWAV